MSSPVAGMCSGLHQHARARHSSSQPEEEGHSEITMIETNCLEALAVSLVAEAEWWRWRLAWWRRPGGGGGGQLGALSAVLLCVVSGSFWWIVD